jgi:hypothetical protein
MPTKAKLVTRASTSSSVSADNLGKGSELTFAEMDGNLINLRDQSFALVGDDSSGINVQGGDTIKVAGANGIAVTATGSTITVDGNAIQLGDLTATGSTLQSPSNADLVLEPGGTGDIHLKTDSASDVKIGELTSNNYFSLLPGSGIFRWNTSGTTSLFLDHSTGGEIEITSSSDGEIKIKPTTTNPTLFGSGSHNATISSNGAHDLILNTNSGTNSGSITITDGADGNITIGCNGTGTITCNSPVSMTSTLAVTGASTLDGVSVSDNHISSAASNADLHIDTSGTGQIKTSAALIGIGDQTGGNIILTDQADGDFQTAAFASPGMLNPSGLQVDSAGSFHYSQLILNNFSTNANNALWTTRSRSNTHGTNAFLQQGDVIFQFFAAGWNGDIDGTGYFSANANVDMFASEDHDASNRGGGVNIQTINTGASSGATTKIEITDNVVVKNPKAATTAALSVEGSIRLKNTSNPSNVTDSAHIFAKDDGSTSEVYVRDEAGNETKISPHNQSGQWEYFSRNINTGKVFRVNMEKMIRKLEQITGESFIETE